MCRSDLHGGARARGIVTVNDKAAADVASSTCAMPGWCGGSRGARMAKVRCASRCWAFVPEPTVGGRAMGAGWSAALQRQSRHQSLPPHVLCMPASGSVSLVGHLRCSAPSSCSMRGSCGKPRRPSESPQQRACSAGSRTSFKYWMYRLYQYRTHEIYVKFMGASQLNLSVSS